MKLLNTVIAIIASFMFATEMMSPDPGITGGVILTCLLVSLVIMMPVIDSGKEEKEDDN